MKKPKLFYGWYIVLACMLIIGAGIGLFHNSFAVFAASVPEDLGFKRGAFALYVTVQAVASTVATPFYAYLFQRFGLRTIMLTASVVCSGIHFGFSFSTHLWQFYVLAAVLGCFDIAIGVIPIGTLCNNWFFEKRGLAAGIAFAGSGLVAAVMIPLLSVVIEHFGWQMAYRTIGGCALALLLPTLLLIIRDKPQDIGLLPLGSSEHERLSPEHGRVLAEGMTRAEALRSPVFYLFAFSTFCSATLSVGLVMHIAAYLSEIGYTAGYAGAIVSLSMLAMLLGKLIFGIIFDRLGLAAGAFLSGFLFFLASSLLLFAGIGAVPLLFALTFGFAYSTQTVSVTLLTSHFFGEKEFTGIFSLVVMVMMIGYAVGSPIPAGIYDVTGSYTAAWLFFVLLSILTTTGYMVAVVLRKKTRAVESSAHSCSSL